MKGVAGVLTDARLTDTTFIWCEQELLQCRRMWKATDAKMEVEDEDTQL